MLRDSPDRTNVQKDCKWSTQCDDGLAMMERFLNKAHSLRLLTLPIGLLDKPVRVDFGERFRKSGVLTIRIFVDKQRNVDPATWLNESLAGLIKGLQYTVNVDVCISGFTVRSMEQVDRIANDFAHAYERLFISRPIPECIIELRLEGRGRLHGRFRYSYSRCPLYVYVER
ncbi:hypothetical protein Tcan_11323 [Toxocara canis]|uniref:Uncharacterized protein n=1 Tax=Toxocara canis TaxID=6265 RepID=A0A0B2VWR8_TOXCA|nr:hypothetical protein Tcan_11323 [Toxocara canis]